jgi:hypothetical protein
MLVVGFPVMGMYDGKKVSYAWGKRPLVLILGNT